MPAATDRATVDPLAQPRPTEQGQAATAQLEISSTPDGADIEIDGNYVGSTPSTVGATAGQHQISLKKSGFEPWERKITVSTGQIKVNAALESESK
jgi:PEGA domain